MKKAMNSLILQASDIPKKIYDYGEVVNNGI